jgi:hypothetical protein
LFLWSETAYWVSAVWLVVMATALLAIPTKRVLLQVYVVAELGMALSTVMSLLLKALFWFGSGSDLKLQTLTAVFIVFSIVPCVAAILLLRNAKLALKLIATFVLSLIGCPVGLWLYYGIFYLFTPRGDWEGLAVALIFPHVVFAFGIGWSFRGAKRAGSDTDMVR